MKYIERSGRIVWGGDNVHDPTCGNNVFRDEAPGLITEDGITCWTSPGRPRPSNPWRSGGGRHTLHPDTDSNIEENELQGWGWEEAARSQ
jgi:hypothetical protein